MKGSNRSSIGHALAAILGSVLLTGPLVAQARDHDDHHRERHAHHGAQHGERNSHRHVEHYSHGAERRYWADQRDYRHAYADGYRRGHYDVGRYYRPHGYRAYAWQRGHRLPVAYCAPRYVVHDYAAYDLYRPPHGHHWVRVDHDVVLAAITTGVVVSVVNNLFY